jgi:hypothetical protein
MNCEIEEGNIEYKRKLSMDNETRITTLITQMYWRLNEGNGEAIYYLGINDDGSIYKFKNNEENETLSAFNYITNVAKIKIVDIKKIKLDREYFYKAIIQTENKLIDEKKIIILGNPGSGKTSFLSFLLNNDTDDGNGYLRNKLLRYDHEFTKGSTESLVIKSIGYDDNHIYNYDKGFNLDEIKKKSIVIVTFFDVPISYIQSNFHLIKYMDHAIIMNNNDNIEKYINSANKYLVPYTIINNKLSYMPLKLTMYKTITSRQNGKGILLLNIISKLSNEYLVTCINMNSKIIVNDTIYFFNNINTSMCFGKILSLRYFNKYIEKIDKNVAFTAKISYNNNLKKQKRNFFYST